MQKHLFIFLVLTQVISALYAQEKELNLHVIKSETFQDDKKITVLIDSKSDTDGGVVTIRSFHKLMGGKLLGYYIEHYNKKLELVKSHTLEYEQNRIRGLIVNNDKVHLIESIVNKKEKTYDFNVLTSSLNEFNFTRKNLLSFDNDKFKEFFGYPIGSFLKVLDNRNLNYTLRGSELADVVLSKNNKFFSVNLYKLYNKNVKIEVNVFDNELNMVHQNELTREIKPRLFEFKDMTINEENGEVYVFGKIKDKKQKSKYYYEIYKIASKGTNQLSLKNDDHFISTLSVVKDHGRLACVGFYSDEKENRYKGVVRFNIDDSEFQLTNTSFNPFSDQFLNDKYGDKKKKDKELRNLSVNSCFMDESGNVVINAEEYFVMQFVQPDKTKEVAHFDDIVSCKISENGELLWSRNINKKQKGYNFTSYSTLTGEGKVYFLFNANDEIRKISDNRIQFGEYSSEAPNIFAVAIGTEGNVDYQKIVPNQGDIIYQVRDGVFNANRSEVIMLGRNKKDKKLIKISL